MSIPKFQFLETEFEVDSINTDAVNEDTEQNVGHLKSSPRQGSPVLSGDQDVLKLRSGVTYPRAVTNFNSTAAMAQANVSQGAAAPQPPTPMLKILPTISHIEPFTGKEDNRTAQSFIRVCETSMVNTGVSDPHDKIAFLKHNLKVGSYAHQALTNEAFVRATQAGNYEEFKGHFLRLVGGVSQKQAVKVINRVCEKVMEKAYSRENVLAGGDAHECLLLLEQVITDFGWVESVKDEDMLTMEHFRTITQLLLYMFFLKREERSAALAIDFKKDAHLWDFQESVACKLEEKSSERKHVAAVTFPVQEEASPVAPITQKPDYSKLQCYYCNKMGHTATVCQIRKKDRAKSQGNVTGTGSNTMTGPNHVARGGAGPSTRPKLPPSRPQGPNVRQGYNPNSHTYAPRHKVSHHQSGKYCQVHKSATHDTTECYSVLRLGEQMAAAYRQGEGNSASRRNPP